ncbi:MAG TPA: hypothetical protein VMX14_13205 [Anaerolineae bacterium]|nr:hypothetical protein [Anaerolineae bacterium]
MPDRKTPEHRLSAAYRCAYHDLRCNTSHGYPHIKATNRPAAVRAITRMDLARRLYWRRTHRHIDQGAAND